MDDVSLNSDLMSAGEGTKTKPNASERMGPYQVALGLERLTRQLKESNQNTKPGDFSHLTTLVRGLCDLSAGIVAGNKGLSLASKKGVLLSHDIGGGRFGPRARIGAYIDLKLSQTFTAAVARKMLDEAISKVRGGGLLALLRGSIAADVVENHPGVVQVKIMDACDTHSEGVLYDAFPSKTARKAELAASVRDAFIEKAKAFGAEIIEYKGGFLD